MLTVSPAQYASPALFWTINFCTILYSLSSLDGSARYYTRFLVLMTILNKFCLFIFILKFTVLSYRMAELQNLRSAFINFLNAKVVFVVHEIAKLVKAGKRVLLIYHPYKIYYDGKGSVFHFPSNAPQTILIIPSGMIRSGACLILIAKWKPNSTNCHMNSAHSLYRVSRDETG